MFDEFRQVGPGRFECVLTMPWGQTVPAEAIVTTRRGWVNRPEAMDERWSADPAGPAVIAIRLRGGLPALSAPGPPTEAVQGRFGSGAARSRASWRAAAVGAC